ncbi:hypothetical protein ncot_14030 [Nocardioides sp. JQ2195]|uniref:hypothetical protein n=1 Tax=Nocardioides sp. JQ2195 TaxID=2592334 RepID=UPI00143ECEDE|nr:hypothetical protein [Nocardioides sp. JQ2195]QIX27594.1 hypothetical protein ncot_14030 [Nocardioides sp. JQ2195]
MKNPLTPDQQKILRETGLLADVHEPYVSPEGLRLDAMPKTFAPKDNRRQRGDRVTKRDAERIGIAGKSRRGRGKRR